MTGAKLPIHTCRPQGPTLRKVLSLKYTEISRHSKRQYFLYYKKVPFGNVIRTVEALKLGSQQGWRWKAVDSNQFN